LKVLKLTRKNNSYLPTIVLTHVAVFSFHEIDCLYYFYDVPAFVVFKQTFQSKSLLSKKKKKKFSFKFYSSACSELD